MVLSRLVEQMRARIARREDQRTSRRKFLAASRPHSRRLSMESLEGRDLLATFYVDNTPTDNVALNTDVFTPSGGSQVVTGGLELGVNLFTTIGAAVAAASPNDLINVADGSYTETVTVNKTLTIRGNQFGVDARTRAGAETIMNAAGGAFYVTSDNSAIDGFTMQDQTAGFLGSAMILGAGFSGHQVLNNIIQNNVFGINLANTGANQAVIQQNLFKDNLNAGAASGHGIYSDQFSAGGVLANVLIDNNAFTNTAFTVNSWAVGMSNTGATAFSGLTISNNHISNHGRGTYFYNTDNSTIVSNTVVAPSNYAFGLFGDDNNVTVENNVVSGGNRGVWIGDDLAIDNSGVKLAFNAFSGLTTGLEVDAGSHTGTIDATCNWWNDITGPTIAANPGGSGQAILDPDGIVDFQPWLVYSPDGDALLPGVQLVTSFSVPAQVGGFTTTNNNYRRLVNAIECLVVGQTVTLSGVFDWTEANAAASWALGNDGVVSAADDYSLLVTPNVNNVTITAAALGSATIQGPGDLAAANLEGFLVFDGGDNQNWTISNLQIFDFDLGLGLFFGAGGSDAFNGTTISNNRIRVPADLNATVAPADVNQNIGIHYSFGINQTIQNNFIDFEGDGVSNSGGGLFSSSVGMQSNTSGGNVYDGLLIDGNVLTVLDAQSADPATILGIWDNAHAHLSDITVSNNQFLNAAVGNDPAVNLQRAFRVTSHSGVATTVAYSNNTVQGANIGFQWIAGSNFTGNQPVQMSGNIISGSQTGVLIQSEGLAHFIGNNFDGATDNQTDIRLNIDANAVTYGAGNQFGGNTYFIDNQDAQALSLTATYDETNNFRIADKMFDALDAGASGLIRFDGTNLYVSEPGTGASDETITRAIAAAATGDTIHIEDGIYTENVDLATPGKDINLSPGSSPGQVIVNGNLTLNGGDTLTIELNGTNPLTQYDNFIINGAVTLGGATLAATAAPPPVDGSSYTIIDNDLVDAVSGTFAGLANGAPLIISGTLFHIFYTGGTGNDVVLIAGTPSTTYVDDDWSVLAPGAFILDADSSIGGNQSAIFGYDAFALVQEAINAVIADGTGRTFVNAGTYNENVVLNKSIDLEGAQVGVDARGRVVGAPNPAVEAVISPTTGAGRPLELQDLSDGSTIDGFAFIGSINGANGVIQSTNGATDSIQLLNNHVEVGAGFTSSAMFLNRSAIDSTFDQNVFLAAAGSSQAVLLDGPDLFHGLQFTNNNVLKNGAATGTGIFVDGNHNVSISASLIAPLISGNLIQGFGTGANLGSRSFGSQLTPNAGTISDNVFNNNTFDGLQGGMQNALITRNTFSNNGRSGLALTSFGNMGADRGAQNSQFTENFFFGNLTEDIFFSSTQPVGSIATNAVFNNSLLSARSATYNGTETINTSGNWWGSNANPEFVVGKIGGAGAANVDYSPWLEVDTDTDLLTAGFQGDFSVLNVDDDSPESAAGGRINEAIGILTNGGTIKIHAGTYLENVDAATPVKDVNLSPGASPAQITINGLSLNAGDTLTLELNGPNPLTDFDNFIVNGAVSLGGAALAATGVPAPAAGSTFTIISNDLADAVIGTFAGLANGASLVISGVPFKIFYTAGSNSNDVLLVAGPPTITYAEDTAWDLLAPGTIVDGNLTTVAIEPAIIGYDAFNTTTAVQDAINAVTAGGTTFVNAGAYQEILLISKALTLQGNNAGIAGGGVRNAESIVVANGAFNTAVISVTAANVTIDGLNIDGDDTLAAGNIMASGDDTNVLYGVFENAAVSNLIVQNNIIEHAFIGVRGDGVSTGNVISQNWFDSIGRFDFGYAVTIRTGFYADITDNLMTRVWTGVHALGHTTIGPATWTMSGNEIHSYAAGLWYNNTSVSATGLTVANNDFIAEAAAVANNIGMFITAVGSAVNPSFTGNTVTGADYGAIVWHATTTSTITFGATNSIVNPEIAGVLLTNSLLFNPVGTTVFGIGGASALNLVGLAITGVVATGIRVDATGGTATTLNVAPGVSVSGGVTGLDLNGATAAIGGNTLSNTSFSGQTGNYIQLGVNTLDNVEIDATAVTFDGTTGGVKTTAQNYAAEDKVVHGVDDSARGFVRVKAGHLFTTPGSFVAPALAADVQDAIDVASNGNTLNIQGGSYTGSANVSPVDLIVSLGESPAQVVINGNVAFDGGDTLVMELNGLTAGTLYDQLVVNGTVSLGNLVDGFASLSATAGFVYPALSFVTLIANDGAGVVADPTAGHFAGQLDGSTINIGGQTFLVFHNGGDGNDVILVKAFPGITPPTVYAEDVNWTDFSFGTFVDGDLSTVPVEPAFIGYNAFNNRPTTAPTTNTPIQDAVDAVIADGTGRVIVNEGSYPENVFINKSLTLEGRLIDAGNATINPGAGVGLTINSASFITVRDINIAAPTALDIDMSGTVNLENLNTAGSGAGGSVDDVDNLFLRTRDNAADNVDVNNTASGQFSSGEIAATSFNLITNFTVQTRGGNDTITAKPTLAGQAMNLHIVGGLPNNAGVPMGDTAGDKLKLDMSDTTGPVIVSTVSGFASSASHRPLTFAEIEDVDLCDDGVLTNVVMGDLYVRGTAASDIIQFSLTKLGTPGVSATQTRVRVNNQFFNLLVSTRTVAYGRGGNDYLQQINLPLPAEFYGEENDDYMTGYTGNDLLVGGLGNDRLLAGDGNNVMWGDNVGEQDLVTGGLDQLSSGTGIDVAYGGGGNDTINLGSNDDYAYGGAGNDTIDGMAGHDRLYGGADNDTISGSEGNDVVAGNGGNDRLYGKGGNDVVIGGDGADIVNGDDGNDLLFDAFVTYDDPGTLLPAGNDASSAKNDANDLAMAALLADWLADGAVNAAFLAVTHDAFVDTISGGVGTDTAYRKAADPNKDTVLEVETQLP